MFALTIASATAALTAQYAGEDNLPERCRFDMNRGAMVLAINNGPIPVAPGERVRVDPRWTPYPSAWDEVPLRCLSGWRVSDSRLARLSADRRTLVIAPGAAAGAQVTLSARYRGQSVTQVFTVIAPIASPLVGTWRQSDPDCPGQDGIFELAFGRDGRFSITYGPAFHSNVDFRGRWRPEGDRVVLTDISPSTPGQALPPDFGTAFSFTVAEDGRLSFSSRWYGRLGARGSCTASFRR